jgi:PEP-CTERM motif
MGMLYVGCWPHAEVRRFKNFIWRIYPMLRNFLALCALGFVTVGVANADPITAGQTIAATVTSITGATTQVGFASGIISPGTFTGSWTESVISGDTSNCAGCLDFVYQFTNTGATGDILQLAGASFGTFLTDVGFVNEGGGTDPVPSTITRTGDGSAIDFTFTGTGEVEPGMTSGLLVVKTNATSFSAGLLSLQDGSAGTDAALAPSAVPEPSSILLFGSGLLGLAGAARRKFAR